MTSLPHRRGSYIRMDIWKGSVLWCRLGVSQAEARLRYTPIEYPWDERNLSLLEMILKEIDETNIAGKRLRLSQT
jgi:hypothetical protein